MLGEDVEKLLELARAQDKQEHFQEMLETAQKICELDPSSAEALALKARALQKLDRMSEATIANDQALLLDTNLPLAWINRSGQQIFCSADKRGHTAPLWADARTC